MMSIDDHSCELIAIGYWATTSRRHRHRSLRRNIPRGDAVLQDQPLLTIQHVERLNLGSPAVDQLVDADDTGG